MIPVRQGVLTCSQPLKNLAADFKAHRIVYDNNPVMKWNLINAEIKADVNNNIQLVHAADRRRRSDGASALMDAYKVLMDKKDSFINMN
jgi:phage terminase large subunit-like protein